MSAFMRVRRDRQWEYWISLALGCVVLLSPWIVEQGTGLPPVVLNSVLVGLAMTFVAGMEIDALKTWEEWVELALGLWLMAAPFVLGYVALTALTALHVVGGGIVALLAALEWWRDRRAGAAN
ncbi:MAG: SPW repeat protein [Alphaproteobacteria bacterium]|nr:SPW repeat protein [Alphaproteobacteria bacterium]